MQGLKEFALEVDLVSPLRHPTGGSPAPWDLPHGPYPEGFGKMGANGFVESHRVQAFVTNPARTI